MIACTEIRSSFFIYVTLLQLCNKHIYAYPNIIWNTQNVNKYIFIQCFVPVNKTHHVRFHQFLWRFSIRWCLMTFIIPLCSYVWMWNKMIMINECMKLLSSRFLFAVIMGTSVLQTLAVRRDQKKSSLQPSVLSCLSLCLGNQVRIVLLQKIRSLYTEIINCLFVEYSLSAKEREWKVKNCLVSFKLSSCHSCVQGANRMSAGPKKPENLFWGMCPLSNLVPFIFP